MFENLELSKPTPTDYWETEMHRSAAIVAAVMLAATLLGLWATSPKPGSPSPATTPSPTLRTTTITISGPTKPNNAGASPEWRDTTPTIPGGGESAAESGTCTKVFWPGPVGYGVSAGYKAPGDEVGVMLYTYKPWDCNFSGFFIVELYGERSREPLYVANHSVEELPIEVRWKLPDKGGTRYRLLVKAVEDGVVVDTLESTIVVPPQEVKAILRMERKSYRVGETAYFTITNLGDTPLTFGSPYEVYRWINGTWVFCDELTPDLWTLELHVLPSGGNFTQGISLRGAEPGLYKVVKRVGGEGTRITLTLWDTFVVVGG